MTQQATFTAPQVRTQSSRARVFECAGYIVAFLGFFAPWGYSTIEWMGKTTTTSLSVGLVSSTWTARLVLISIAAALILQFIRSAARFRGLASLVALGFSGYFAFSFFDGAEKFAALGGSFLPGPGLVLTLAGLITAVVLWARGVRQGGTPTASEAEAGVGAMRS